MTIKTKYTDPKWPHQYTYLECGNDNGSRKETGSCLLFNRAKMSWTELEANWNPSEENWLWWEQVLYKLLIMGHRLPALNESRTTLFKFGLSLSHFSCQQLPWYKSVISCLPTGSIQEALGDVQIGPRATPLGPSTHHLMYPVYTPVRHDITITCVVDILTTGDLISTTLHNCIVACVPA